MELRMPEDYFDEDDAIARLTTDEAKDHLDSIIKRVALGEERIILSQDGKDVAAVISIEEFCLLERLIRELEDKIDLEDAQKILAQTKPEEYVSYKEFRKELQIE